MRHHHIAVALCMIFAVSQSLHAQNLELKLATETTTELATAAMKLGDAKRGAIVFHRVTVGCGKCHSVFDKTKVDSITRLGPNISQLKSQKDATNEHIVESILKPSAKIRKGFETVTVIRTNGTVLTGLKVGEGGDGSVLLQEASKDQPTKIPANDVVELAVGETSIMPKGVINSLASRQQFLDLVRYVIEIRDGGSARAKQLHPPAALIAFRVPEYESKIDHAKLIGSFNKESFKRGEAIYNRLCINCHGDLQRPGSLPTALRFGEGKFRNGNDPFAMYQTLTHGFGLMLPQTWMVPKQKYDVIHYVREAYLKERNPSQYFAVNDAYLASLPPGDTLGPEPVEFAPWRDMDYGPWMHNTIEIGRGLSNVAYKGIAVRLDPGPGGIARGNRWMLFDHDTMRIAGAWSHPQGSKSRFIDWQGIHFDGRHQAHPHAVGDFIFENPTGPGWADPATDSFEDNRRVIGRDDKRYGPLPKDWSEYHGLYHTPQGVVVDYSVGGKRVLETFGAIKSNNPTLSPVMTRTLQLQPTSKPRTLLIATLPIANTKSQMIGEKAVLLGAGRTSSLEKQLTESKVQTGTFDGAEWLQVNDAKSLNTFTKDFTVTARIKTRQDGVIFANTTPGPKWVPNGTALFIRGGRLCYDIGWVGVVQSKKKIADDKWHEVAISWSHETETVRLFVDRKPVAMGKLAAEKALEKSVFRIGYGAPNFPKPSQFVGQIQDVKFYDAILPDDSITKGSSETIFPTAYWLSTNPRIASKGPKLVAVKNAESTIEQEPSARLLAGIEGDVDGFKIEQRGKQLCLKIPPSKAFRTFTVWTAKPAGEGDLTDSAFATIQESVRDDMPSQPLDQLVNIPAENLWPEVLKTTANKGKTNENGFAVDELTAPNPNPWLARLRFSGLDFYDDGDRLAICSWDGDVYEVSGLVALKSDEAATLIWKRIASGLFQPLGLKIVDGEIYLTCRDQMVILRDRNHDGATDFFECFNNDQQVTEHFHEFAMGLQRDDDGNFYYAKSARHAKPALVPHHGTLLKVTPDGSSTEILAVGFRAANGVCFNPDGSFVVTDQEGHWNPKNRINWVTNGGFYGNMYGYHDITDSSDAAMEQPLCWITNSFDRSPAELLWSKPTQWGNLNSTLLNLSYGYGKVFTVPHEHLDDKGGVQGAMCEIPIEQFPTGTMRGRFHPQDGQLYVCGLFAWASSQQTKEGGVYRIRYEGTGAMMPLKTEVRKEQLLITFSDEIDPDTVKSVKNFHMKTWDLKRTKNYGSKHYNEQELKIDSAELSADGKTLSLTIPKLAPTWCYELRCSLTTRDDRNVERVLHGTIHKLK